MTVYRWEPDEESYGHDGGMILRTDDNRSQEAAYQAQYFLMDGEWNWIANAPTGRHIDEGECATADEARRACELAVLHGEAPYA